MTIDKTDQAGDVARLGALKAEEDPRTIAQMIAEDDSATDYTLTKVTIREGDSAELALEDKTADGLSCGIVREGPRVHVLQVGDRITLYGRFGFPVYGWAVNGEVVEYQTPWERFAERMAMLARFDRQNRERFEEQRGELDAKYDALPAPLKARIDRFRAESPAFRVDSEGYEMAAVGDAPKIARAIAKQHEWEIDDNLAVDSGYADQEQIANAVKAFYDLPYEEQKALVPDLEPGHSGNTFGGAVALARAVLQGHEV